MHHRTLRLVLFFVLLIPSVLAKCIFSKGDPESTTIQLWDSDSTSVSNEQPLPSRGDNVIRLTNINQPSLKVFPVKAKRKKPAPAVLVFPGGAYQYLAYNKEGTDVAEWLNNIGVTAVVVKYTVPENRDAAFMDAQRAIRLVRKNAAKWHVDPEKIGVLGFSAGGHLSVRLSNSFGLESYEPGDEADLLSSRPDFSIHIYPAYLDSKETEGELTEEIQISEHTPPTFMVQTKDDVNYVPGTIIYNRVLEESGIPVTFHLFEEGGHGYGLRPENPEVATWPTLLEKWLKEIDVLR